MSGGKRQPLSLAELKRRRELEKEQLKPVFMSEKARAHQRRIAEIEKRAEEKLTKSYSSKSTNNSNRYERLPLRASSSPANGSSDRELALDEKERLAIQRQYMNKRSSEDREKRSTATRPSDKARFRFKWDASDDTMGNEDEVRLKLQRKMEKTALQFGRGRQAGMDSLFGNSRKRPKDNLAVGSSSETKRGRRRYDERHWHDKPRQEMTDRDWRIFREDFLISVRGVRVPHPARKWDECGLPRSMLRLVLNTYDTPTPIQMATIPICVARRDVIGLAQTGSGKTAAYVLPMLKHILEMPTLTVDLARHGPYALVLAPTRELAQQIEDEARKFAKPLGIRAVSVIGGQDLDLQAQELQKGTEIIICTPGRMVDLISRRMAALGNCNFVVLDEADRMVDMGFEPQVQEILAAMPAQLSTGSQTKEAVVVGLRDSLKVSNRQTLMFSATMVPAVERLVRTYLMSPVIVTIGETGQAADNVDQRVEYFESDGRRRNRLMELLKTLESPILVFVNTKSGCDVVARFVESTSRIRTVVMHGGKSQEIRESSLEGFKTGRFKVMIATDVVGRGIDIKGVKNVINFEMPDSIDKYTHRIGRTGRAGEKGTAWSLTSPSDSDIFPELRKLLGRAGANIPHQIARHDGGSSNTSGYARPGKQTFGKPIID